MELVNELGILGVGSARRAWGTFLCPACEVEVDKPLNSGYRNKSCGNSVCRRSMFTPNKSCKGNTKLIPDYSLPFYSSIKERYRLIKLEHKLCSEWGTLKGFMDDMYDSYVEARINCKYLAFNVDGAVASKASCIWTPKSKYARFDKLTASKSSYVYIVSVEGFYKIGMTKRLADRMEAFNTSNPYEVKVVTAIPVSNASSIEKKLHLLYAEHNVKGEWFNLTESQVEDIIKYLNDL